MKALYTLPSQKKALKIEASRQVYEARDRLFNDMDAVILWALHEEFGFGADRLKRFYQSFILNYRELQNHYELGDDTPFVCKERLRQIGVDVEEWDKEFYK